MLCLKGVPISPGYAKGIAVVFNAQATLHVPRYHIERGDVDGEIARFHEALERSSHELRQLERRVLAEIGKAHSSIFSSHLTLLRDKQFTEGVTQRIHGELINVEHALDQEIDNLTKLLASVENEYLRERAQDIRDIGNRLQRQLADTNAGRLSHLPLHSIVVARELLPSETIDLDRQHVVGIVTENGGENSHASILARALGIPGVTGVADAVSRIPRGAHVLVDGQSGHVTVMPNDAAASEFAVLKEHFDDSATAAIRAEHLDCMTLDGTHISLLGNINRVEETPQVGEHHLDGVGLFRTEFMYLDSLEPPSFDRQVDVYRQVIAGLGGRRLVIRTLDLGGDKLPAFLIPHHEANPNLGSRGLRFSLDQRELFATQLRAIVTAAAGHNVNVMFPMVLGEGDLQRGIEELRAAAHECGIYKIPPLGAMIETPSALFALPEILRLVEFVSIGTNDLTQLMLAADRNASELADDYSVLHPSVLRAIKHVVQACNDASRELCVCGESAGNAETAVLLVGLGVRQLSVSPVRAAAVRLMVRSVEQKKVAQLAEKALAAPSVRDVRQLLRGLSAEILCPRLANAP